MKKYIASLTSNILNPFLVGAAVIFLLSFESTASTADGLKWSFIVIGTTILPVFLVILYLVHKDKVTGIFVRVRQQRNRVYALAVLCTLAGSLVLHFLEAPLVLVAAIVATLSSVIIFMVINFRWKISLHTAFAAGSATALTLVYGAVGAVAAIMLPPVAWSRIELEQHTVWQTIAGALLAAVIVVVVFHLFGLVGSTKALQA
jgi:membrane-associated phospholipid phosphatase